MNNLKISSVQFENKSGDKKYNLSIIEKLSCWRKRLACADYTIALWAEFEALN